MKRESISKTTRFEVFKRDHFTCQYCGAQPPKVVLVIDHVHPIAAGGDNDLSNLVTACGPCNAGKGARLLSAIPIRPDADLLYLSAQQELAELKRYKKAQAALRKERQEVVGALQDIWCELSGFDWCPNDPVLRRMLERHDVEDVHEAVVVTAGKVVSKQVNKYSWEPYMWGILRNRREER